MREFLPRALKTLVICLAAVWTGSFAAADETTSAVEPWSDPQLPVKDGLRIWLDASTLAEARKALELDPTDEGDPLDLWPDGSGNRHHVEQTGAENRPRYAVTEQFHAVRFGDGDTWLNRSGIDAAPRDVTLFIVAAPYANVGMFAAFLSMSELDQSDFQTGMNVDQGPARSERLEAISIEGAGHQGSKNQFDEKLDFGNVVRIGVTSTPGENGVSLFVNGERRGERDRAPESRVKMSQFVVGARYYTAFGGSPFKGYFDGDVAEVLVYDRLLTPEERAQVDRYLADKYGRIGTLPLPHPLPGSAPLVRIEDPPPVQMFVPGFSVRRLPVELTNINNVQYRPDGKLVALGYDGRIHLLSDTDGDGLEDTAEVFWDNGNGEEGALTGTIGMALTPPDYSHGEGVFVAAKGKCSLIVDSSGDGRADREIVVAEGWKPLWHGVDALGIDVDPRDGSVYFGLGTWNFANAYMTDDDGQAQYKLESERGTILRVAPDFQSREIVATGIRFPVSIRFNEAGDLFCTDQEGATWLPNGNPYDELLHVRKGRHYGFPPRHPKHLPDVIDEPSVYDYGPQHQATCGMNFNEPVNGGPHFGPEWWRSDALVTGYSRGKIYRTSLVSTAEGYLARNQIIACLNMLTVDLCVAPDGGLIVACHSGGPDWGSGPTGAGTLYKIAYSGPEAPQPSLVWPESPREVRVAFDRPLDPARLAGLAKEARLEYGRYVAAGDRFESLLPGYQVVQNQLRTPRYELAIHSLALTPDGRTLILMTDPHPENVSYALTLPGLGRGEEATPGNGSHGRDRDLPQVPETDLQYDLSGLAAEWISADGETRSSVWLPHPDLDVSRELTAASAEHAAFYDLCRTSGTLTLRGRFDLKDMLRPEVQHGSSIDYEWPEEHVTLTFRSRNRFRLETTAADAAGEAGSPPDEAEQTGEGDVASVTFRSDDLPLITITFTTDSRRPDMHVSWHTNEDPRPRALALHRLRLPWAPTGTTETPTFNVADVPELEGGDWANGRKIYFGEQALCSKCHYYHGEGGIIGPDLSNLSHRDYHSVLRDIEQPSFALNPDYLTQTIGLVDGRILTGVVRTEGNRLHVGDAKGNVTVISRDEIEQIRPSPLSVMPEKLLDELGPEKTRDLLTFLLSGPPRMPDYGDRQPPPVRSMQEVESVLAGSEPLPSEPRELNVVLVAGRKDHGPGEHDYPAWKVMWQRLMSLAPHTTTVTADEWPTPEQLETADVMVFYQQGTWTPERARDIDAYLARGGGLVYIHYAVDGGQDAPGFAQRIGLAWKGGASKFRHGELDLGFDPAQDHPIARNFDTLDLHDESYWQLLGDPDRITLLATGKEEGKDQPLFWTMQPSRGRVFVSIPGHFSWTFDDPLFRILLLRGIAWTAREPVDRFNDLVLPGARVTN